MDNKPFKVGDKVFDLRFGNGIVMANSIKNAYSVEVRFEDGETCCYIPNGKSYVEHATAMLYHGHDLVVEVKEPVYEYQFIGKDVYNRFYLTKQWYSDYDKIHWTESSLVNWTTDVFEPSKRLRK